MIFGTIACLGDSLTFGARAALGYPEILPELLNEPGGTEWATLNRGISGQTTREILDRTPAVVRELAAHAGAKWLVVLVGTNDAKRGGITHHAYEDLMRQLLHWPRRADIPVLLCTHPPLDYRPMPAFDNRSAETLTIFSSIVRELAEKYGMRLCDLRTMSADDLCGDGVHLTQDGYRWVANQVAAALRGPP